MAHPTRQTRSSRNAESGALAVENPNGNPHESAGKLGRDPAPQRRGRRDQSSSEATAAGAGTPAFSSDVPSTSPASKRAGLSMVAEQQGFTSSLPEQHVLEEHLPGQQILEEHLSGQQPEQQLSGQPSEQHLSGQPSEQQLSQEQHVLDHNLADLDLALGVPPSQEMPSQEMSGEQPSQEISSHSEPLLKDVLSSMSYHSSKIFNLLVSWLDGAKQLPDGETRQRAWDMWLPRLQFSELEYEPVQMHFVSDGRPFITPDDLNRSTHSTHSEETLRLAEKVVCSANLVSLLKSMVKFGNGVLPIQPILEDLDGLFPNVFDARTIRDQEEAETAAEITLNLMHRIRCCCLPLRLQAHPDKNAYVLAAQLFCDGDVHTVKEAKRALLEGPYKPFPDVAAGNVLISTSDPPTNMSELTGYLLEKERSTVIDGLNGVFDFHQLPGDLEAWSRQVYEQINNGKDKQEDDFASQSMAPTPMEDDEEGSDPEPEPIFRRVQSTPIRSWLDDDVTLESAQLELSQTPRAAPPSKQPAKKRTKRVDPNRFNNLGLDEIRSGVASSSASTNRWAPQTQPSTADDAGGDDDDDDDDDAYETNNRPADLKRRLPKDGDYALMPPPPKRVRRPRPAPSQPPADSQDEDGLDSQDFASVSLRAREAGREASARQEKAAQKRTAWTDSDNALLIKTIPKYQCSWAAIEQDAPFSVHRNQQQIRDRARNLKVDFLKAGELLPAGFDGIALGKKERDAVIKCRRNPDRREKDIDAEGNPVNVVYIPTDDEENPFI